MIDDSYLDEIEKLSRPQESGRKKSMSSTKKTSKHQRASIETTSSARSGNSERRQSAQRPQFDNGGFFGPSTGVEVGGGWSWGWSHTASTSHWTGNHDNTSHH